MKKNLFWLAGLVCALFLAQIACSLPGSSEAQVDGSQPVSPSQQQTPEAPGAGEAQPTEQPGQGNQQPQGSLACQNGFIANANIANGQSFQSDESFQVAWTLENTGDCTWDNDYALKLLAGEIISAENMLPLTSTVNPGGTTSLSVNMQAPSAPGHYVSAWKMQDSQGHLFGQDTPPNAPLRIAIKVIPAGNQGNNPTPAPEANPDALISGNDLTLLHDQCFDLNNGQEVDCSDPAADISYQFNALLSGKFHGENNTELANNRDDEPDKAACEAELYPPIPHSALEDKFFCFQISNIVNTTYGWIRVERFDQDGVTFDFMTFKADPPEMQPINPNGLFVESQGDQISMLAGECFDVQNGQPNEQCSGIFAGFLFEQVTKKALQVMQIAPNEAVFSAVMSTEPTKTECQNATYNQSPIWPIVETHYYCVKFTPGMNTYFGWLRPTHFDSNGLTFDYLTWQALP